VALIYDLRFNLEDLSQIAIGSFALAVPISFSEEAWRFGETLPKFPILTDPLIALKRMIVITMPASMGAIIVDSLDKE